MLHNFTTQPISQQHWRHLASLPLRHHGDCHLLGMDAAGQIYVEELYGEDDWLAQHTLTPDGKLHTRDEDYGAVSIEPFPLPESLLRPQPARHAVPLNFGGARERGLRAEDRVDALVRPLSMPEKMLLVERLRLAILPPLLLGLAASTVLAEASQPGSGAVLVCRRLRFAYALPAPRLDKQALPYDYDSIAVAAVQVYDPASGDEPPLELLFQPFCGVRFQRPQSCLRTGTRLIIADSAAPDNAQSVSQIHLFEWEQISSS